ncbi:MAG: acylphosphatase [Pseudomonadota bacterium]|nr:acylphosphatase [Pseudomonadota bacterium]
MKDQPRKAVHAVVRGRVQGVGYRAWLAREATGRGLDGWARNRRDGTVETVLAGPGGVVDEVLDRLWCGPAVARVEAVETAPAEDPGPGFDVRPTR